CGAWDNSLSAGRF
nr:immunoglobulin light chain junction region [Macaca mulatta]